MATTGATNALAVAMKMFPAKLLRGLTHPGPISRIWAIICRAYHHAHPLVGQLCVPCLDIHANMASDALDSVPWPSLVR